MAALLVALAVMSLMLIVLLPAWSTQAKREKEAELVFRGEQYARAIRLWGQRGRANALPPNVDVLVREKYLRKKYKDPVTGEDFVVLGPGAAAPGSVGQAPARAGGTGAGRGAQAGGPATGRGATAAGGATGLGTVVAGVAGVASKSTESSLRMYNGRSRYNEWVFMPVQGTTAAGLGPRGGARGANQPGPEQPGRGGRGANRGGLQLPQPGGRGATQGPVGF
jgi:type II secretory pathway pseudopilin PulG